MRREIYCDSLRQFSKHFLWVFIHGNGFNSWALYELYNNA